MVRWEVSLLTISEEISGGMLVKGQFSVHSDFLLDQGVVKLLGCSHKTLVRSEGSLSSRGCLWFLLSGCRVFCVAMSGKKKVCPFRRPISGLLVVARYHIYLTSKYSQLKTMVAHILGPISGLVTRLSDTASIFVETENITSDGWASRYGIYVHGA